MVKVLRLLRVFFKDEGGAELIQFALALPVLVGLVFAGSQFWQMMSLRARVRTVTAQVSAYLAEFGAGPRAGDPSPYQQADPADVCAQAEILIREGIKNLPEGSLMTVTLVEFIDPINSNWDGNAVSVTEPCEAFLARLECNQFFGVQVDVSVPMEWVVRVRGKAERESFVLNVRERAVRIKPCQPYFKISDLRAVKRSEGSGGCEVEITWTPEGSVLPQWLQVIVAGRERPEDRVRGAEIKKGRMTVKIPPDECTYIRVKAGANGKIIASADFGQVCCGTPEPTPTPSP